MQTVPAAFPAASATSVPPSAANSSRRVPAASVPSAPTRTLLLRPSLLRADPTSKETKSSQDTQRQQEVLVLPARSSEEAEREVLLLRPSLLRADPASKESKTSSHEAEQVLVKNLPPQGEQETRPVDGVTPVRRIPAAATGVLPSSPSLLPDTTRKVEPLRAGPGDQAAPAGPPLVLVKGEWTILKEEGGEDGAEGRGC